MPRKVSKNYLKVKKFKIRKKYFFNVLKSSKIVFFFKEYALKSIKKVFKS